MIELTQPPSMNQSRGRRPAVRTDEDGKKEPPKTPQQIKLDALQRLRRGLSSQRWHVLDLLATGGVLSVAQCQASYRALRKYAQEQLVVRLPYTMTEVSQAMEACGLPSRNDTSSLLYTLGPLGVEIAKQRHGQPPPTGYLAYPLQRSLLDVVRNEIVLRLAYDAESQGWSVNWLNRHEAKLLKEGDAILEPSALLILRKEEQEKAFLIEYHDEDNPMRVSEQVRRYETACTTDLWRSQWDVDIFLSILVVFRFPVVGDGYRNAIRERERVQGRYYGKLLDGVLEGGKLGEWTNIASGQREPLLG